MKALFLWIIGFYQRVISPLKKPCCRFYPTCSAYAKEAIGKHGALKGSMLSAWRILRCNPLCKGGIDYVPEEFVLFKKITLKKKDDQ